METMSPTDFKNSSYILCAKGFGYSYRNSIMKVVEGFATEDAAIAYMNSHPYDELYLCKGPYMHSKPKTTVELHYMK
jgi:hypothetical protein